MKQSFTFTSKLQSVVWYLSFRIPKAIPVTKPKNLGVLGAGNTYSDRTEYPLTTVCPGHTWSGRRRRRNSRGYTTRSMWSRTHWTRRRSARRTAGCTAPYSGLLQQQTRAWWSPGASQDRREMSAILACENVSTLCVVQVDCSALRKNYNSWLI